MINLISFLWLIRTARAILLWVYLWQLKEYRLDRFLDFLKNRNGRKVLFNKLLFLKIILLFCFLLSSAILPFMQFTQIESDIRECRFLTTAIFLPFLLLILYFSESAKCFKDFFQKKIKKPVFTKKAVLISIFNSLIFISVPIFLWVKIQSDQIIYDFPPLIRFCSWLLTIDIFTPIIISLIILSFQPLTIFLKKRIIQKAKNKIARYPNLIVVGITGSYGKTSTKEFLATILSQKFNILKTIKANTDIGVAKTILEKLKPEHQIFVVEMGAYKRGEIKAICDIVKPKIGVLTGINEQHLALFGGLENTIRAKFELIEALPEDGLGVINKKLKVSAFVPAGTTADKQNSKFKVAVKSLKFFSGSEKSDIYASDIIIEKDKIKFKVINGEESEDFEVSLIGKQNVSNILACVAVAEYLGMTLKEISKAAKKIKPIEKTMKAYQGINGITLIDDTYNANPAGVLAALDYLENFGDKSDRKIILFPGIIELGAATAKVHQMLGKKMAEVCDLIIITRKDFADYITPFYSPPKLGGVKGGSISPLYQGGVKGGSISPLYQGGVKGGSISPLYQGGVKGGKKFIIQENPEKVYQILKNHLKSGDVVLFESRGMETVLERLKR